VPWRMPQPSTAPLLGDETHRLCQLGARDVGIYLHRLKAAMPQELLEDQHVAAGFLGHPRCEGMAK